MIGIETTVMRTCIRILIRIHKPFGGYTYPGDKHIDLDMGIKTLAFGILTMVIGELTLIIDILA